MGKLWPGFKKLDSSLRRVGFKVLGFDLIKEVNYDLLIS